MEEINDLPFRLLCKNAGCGLTYTGMINPLSKNKIYLDDKPALQLFCVSPRGIKEFIKKHNKEVLLWDLNLGCPAKNARKTGFGSYLKDLTKIEEILKTMRESTKKPITLKMRKSKLSFDILKLAEKYCDGVCIHPRTQEQGYSGEPDIKFAEEIKSKTFLPVIYSGNVNLKNYKNLLEKFDYIMVGRESIGHPEIFAKMTNTPFEISFKDYLKLAKKYSLYFRQIKIQAMNFTKGMKNSTKIRLELFNTKNIEEIEKIIL